MTETLADLCRVLAGDEGTFAHFLGMAAVGSTGSLTRWLKRLVRQLGLRGSPTSYEGPSVPRATLLECRQLLERIIAEAARRAGWDESDDSAAARHLHEQGIMTAQQVEAYERLRQYTDRLKHEIGLAASPKEVRQAVKETLDLTREVHRRSVEAQPEVDHRIG